MQHLHKSLTSFTLCCFMLACSPRVAGYVLYLWLERVVKLKNKVFVRIDNNTKTMS